MDEQSLEEKYADKMEYLIGGDPESTHIAADLLLVDLLNELGYEKVTEAYKQVSKWYA